MQNYLGLQALFKHGLQISKIWYTTKISLSKKIIIPGAHHAGLQHVKGSLMYKLGLFKILGVNDFYQLSEDFQNQFIDLISVSQLSSTKELLEQGVRYLDCRLTTDPDSGEIVISNLFLSNHLVSDFLKDLKAFMTNHPDEVIILDIRDDFQNDYPRPGYSVTQAEIDYQISLYIDDNLILDPILLDEPIKNVKGDIFLTGDMSLLFSYNRAYYIDDWPTTNDPAPQTVVENVFSYVRNKQIQDLITIINRVDPYVSPQNEEVKTSFQFHFHNPDEQQVYSHEKIALIDPANLLRMADITNQKFLDKIKSVVKDYSHLNIVNLDKISEDLSTKIINLNEDLKVKFKRQ
eukprot:403355227